MAPLRAADGAGSAETRAVAYLATEVPRWSQENNCFSCHNNGDGARALLVAQGEAQAVPPEALRDTLAWLLQPARWDEIKGQPEGSDTKLARIQFAGALTDAYQTGAVERSTATNALHAAAESLLTLQDDDGSWRVDADGILGSPTTYGNMLATYVARRALLAADAARFQPAIHRADAWIRAQRPSATVDSAARLLALAERADDTGDRRADIPPAALTGSLERLIAAQGSDGGWGPYPKSPSEPFDTAIALLALTEALNLGATDVETLLATLARGRQYLTESQLRGGGWPPTTRPSGFDSYAQHISTSAWATLALLKTGP